MWIGSIKHLTAPAVVVPAAPNDRTGGAAIDDAVNGRPAHGA
jgi:hypothetical protein